MQPQTHTQYTTIKMSSCRCPIQRLCSLSIDRAAAPPNPCAIALYRSVAGIQCRDCDGWSLVWGDKTQHIKIQRHGGGGIGLRWPLFGKKSNNQPIVGGNNARDDGEGARLGRSVWGGCCLFMWGSKLSDAKNTKNKTCRGLDGHVTIFHMQQTTKNMWA
jgi:hypothetical protein